MSNNRRISSNDWLVYLSVVYVVIAVTMNIFCMKSLSFSSQIIICDGGLLISWGVFLISNVIVEVWGEKESVKIVTFATIVTFIMMLIAKLIVYIPTLEEYSEQADAFQRIFSNGPRTIISSMIAFWMGNVINVHIIAKIKASIPQKKDNKLLFWFRAAISTLVGQLVDNAIFMVLAFAPIGLSIYEMAWKDILSSVLSGTVIELVIESCLVPFITIPLTRKIQEVRSKEMECVA